jgi:hypothetical protein
MRISKKWIALLALACFLIGTVGLGITMNMKPDLGTEEIDISKAIDGNLVGQLTVQTDISDITVVPSLDGDIHIRYAGRIASVDRDYAAIHVEQSGDSANVNVETTKSFQIGIDVNRLAAMIRSSDQAKVELALPGKAFRMLKLSSSTGHIRVESGRADDFRVQTDTGGIEIVAFESNTSDIQSDTGRISMAHVKGDLNVQSDTGRVTINVDEFKNPITVKTDTGGITVLMPAPPHIRVDLQSDTGRTTAAIPGMTFEENEKHRVIGSYGNGNPFVKATSDTGNITVDVR